MSDIHLSAQTRQILLDLYNNDGHAGELTLAELTHRINNLPDGTNPRITYELNIIKDHFDHFDPTPGDNFLASGSTLVSNLLASRPVNLYTMLPTSVRGSLAEPPRPTGDGLSNVSAYRGPDGNATVPASMQIPAGTAGLTTVTTATMFPEGIGNYLYNPPHTHPDAGLISNAGPIGTYSLNEPGFNSTVSISGGYFRVLTYHNNYGQETNGVNTVSEILIPLESTEAVPGSGGTRRIGLIEYAQTQGYGVATDTTFSNSERTFDLTTDTGRQDFANWFILTALQGDLSRLNGLRTNGTLHSAVWAARDIEQLRSRSGSTDPNSKSWGENLGSFIAQRPAMSAGVAGTGLWFLLGRRIVPPILRNMKSWWTGAKAAPKAGLGMLGKFKLFGKLFAGLALLDLAVNAIRISYSQEGWSARNTTAFAISAGAIALACCLPLAWAPLAIIGASIATSFVTKENANSIVSGFQDLGTVVSNAVSGTVDDINRGLSGS